MYDEISAMLTAELKNIAALSKVRMQSAASEAFLKLEQELEIVMKDAALNKSGIKCIETRLQCQKEILAQVGYLSSTWASDGIKKTPVERLRPISRKSFERAASAGDADNADDDSDGGSRGDSAGEDESNAVEADDGSDGDSAGGDESDAAEADEQDWNF